MLKFSGIFTMGICSDTSFAILFPSFILLSFLPTFSPSFFISTSHSAACGSDQFLSIYYQVGQCSGGVIFTVEGTTGCFIRTLYFRH
jgi:hypothetical protein